MPKALLDVPRIAAITLDLDDTLWPVWPTIAHAETQLQSWLHQHAPAAAVLGADREQAKAIRQQVHAEWADQRHDLSLMRREHIRRLLRMTGEDEALAEPAFEVFFDARQQVTLFDEVPTALRWLASRYPLIALSNGNADVGRVGLGAWFRGSASARDVGVAKPDARIFEAGAQLAGVPPAAVLHVGDDPHLDVAGAQAAAMQTVWVNREAKPWPDDLLATADLEVPDLRALCLQLGAPAALWDAALPVR